MSGMSLKKLMQLHTYDLLGHKNFKQFGTKFPLLIKFIDAKSDLSVQLHPNDKLAKSRHNSFGKTEMWYVVQADYDSKLIVGFNQPMTKELYLKHLEAKTLKSILNFDKVDAGDTYFIEVGRIHAIGAGVLLAEIQQTSDIALEAFNFNMPDNFRINYSRDSQKTKELVTCPYFTTNIIQLKTPLLIDNNHDSFMIYMCIEGSAIINAMGNQTEFCKGETVLIPACIKSFSISTNHAKLLEVYI